MSNDDLTADVREALDPTPASEVEWPVSRRDTLRALAGVGALAVGPGGAQGAAGTGIADEAYFSNYGWAPDAEGGVLTIDGAEFTFDGSETLVLPDGREASTIVLDDGREASAVVGPGGSELLAPAIPDSGVARWEFEQDVTDSWYGNDLTDNTSAGYSTNAQEGTYSKSFDRTDDSTDLSDGSAFVYDSFSVRTWLYPTWVDSSLSYNPCFFALRSGSGTRFSLHVGSGTGNYNQLAIFNGNDSTNPSVSQIAQDTWTDVVLTYNSGSWTIYENGNESSTSSNPVSGTEPLHIGSSTGGQEFWGGNIDDARFYSKELTSTEVSNLYNTGNING